MEKRRGVLDYLSVVRQKGTRGDLVRGSLGTISIKVAGAGLRFVISVLLARLLGVEDYGFYAYIFSLITLFSMPSQFGFPNLLVREVAKFKAEASHFFYVWRWANRNTLLLSVIAVLLFFLFKQFFVTEAHKDDEDIFRWAPLLIPVIALSSLRSGALRGLKKAFTAQIPEEVVRPICFAVIILIFFFVSREKLTPATAMACNFFAMLIALSVGYYLLQRNWPDKKDAAPNPSVDNKLLWVSASSLALISSLQVINSNVDVIMLGKLADTSEVAYYKVAVAASALLIFGLQSVNLVIMPYLARLYKEGDTQSIKRLVKVAARASFVFSSAVFLVFILFGQELIELAYGDAYEFAYVCLLILCLGQSVNALVGPVGYFLVMSGKENVILKVMPIFLLINVCANYLLIPIYGAEGAAVATVLGLVIKNIVLWAYAYIRMRVDCSAIGLSRK